jgi:hypothetical protein
VDSTDDPKCNYVIIRHGAEHDGCSRKEGDLLVKVWNRGKSSSDLEWSIATHRVDLENDHAAYAERYGPDVEGVEKYPKEAEKA